MKRFKLIVTDTYHRTTTASSTHQTTDDSELLAYSSEASSYSQSHICMPLTYRKVDSAASGLSSSCSCGVSVSTKQKAQLISLSITLFIQRFYVALASREHFFVLLYVGPGLLQH